MARKKRRGSKGSGSVTRRGSTWAVRWLERGRVRYRGGFETRDLAEKVRAQIVAEVQAGRAGVPEEPKPVDLLEVLAGEWLTRRKKTHRAARVDVGRWNNHLRAFFGKCRPAEVDAAGIRRFVEAKLGELNAATVGHCVRLLSTFFSDLVERGLAPTNPVRAVPRATRRLYRPTTDPRSTPFLEKLGDVKRVFMALDEPYNVAFAVGALAGLRTGEVLGLDWRDIDLPGRRIIVRQQMREGELARLKDEESRVTPILQPLAPILAAWKLKTGGEGIVFKPKYARRGGRPESPPQFIRLHTLGANLDKVLEDCKLPALTWYQATRHTFASQWVLGGGSIEKLATVMGHSSVIVTERYAHLRLDLFREADYRVLDLDLTAGNVVELPRRDSENGAIRYTQGTQAPERAERVGATT